MPTDRTVKLVPNQKLIIVNKAESNKKNLYCVLNLQALDRACNVLQSKAGIKLYLYLAKNQDKYTFALSSRHFEEWAGVSKTAYDTAVKELIDNGYLVLKKDKKETYDFYESGKEAIKVTNPIVKLLEEEKKDSGFEF